MPYSRYAVSNVRSATFPAYTLGVREVPVHTCAMAPSIEGSVRRRDSGLMICHWV